MGPEYGFKIRVNRQYHATAKHNTEYIRMYNMNAKMKKKIQTELDQTYGNSTPCKI